MRKAVTSILFAAFSLIVNAQEENWQPIRVWPFVFEHFTNATIYLTGSEKVVKAPANVHVGASTLWYDSNGKKLAAKAGTASRVVFNSGEEYVMIDNKLCQVLRTDTVDGKVAHFYMSPQLDRATFEEQAKQNNQSTMILADFSASFQDFASGVRDNEGARDFDHEPLPMRNRFFGSIGDDVFELTEGNIMKRLTTKEERRTYGAYTRKAEVIYSNRRSMEAVWNTFFLK